MAKFRLLILVFILVAAAYFLVFEIISVSSQKDSPTVLASQSFFGQLNNGEKLPETDNASSQKAKEDALIADLQGLIATSSAKVGIAITDLDQGRSFGVNQDENFDLASVEKLLVATYAFSQIDAGVFQPDQIVAGEPLIEHLRLLINHSDDNSWDKLNSFLGLGNLQNFAKELGLVNLSVSENKGTPADTNRLLLKIYDEHFLSPGSREKLLSFMRNTLYEQRIPQALPKEAIIYHKTGTINTAVNDAAIVMHPQKPFVITILTDNVLQESVGDQLIHQIARKVWDFFDKA